MGLRALETTPFSALSREGSVGKVETTNSVPPPGSDEAIALSCECPVLDNGYGRGYYGQPGVYVYTVGCPVHAPAITTNFTDTSASPATMTAYVTGADDWRPSDA